MVDCVILDTTISTGLVSSAIVTVALQVEEFPALSVTVNITILAPRFVQSNVVKSKVIFAIAQLSVLLLLISETEMLAFPDASNCTRMLLQFAVGGTSSATVISKEQPIGPFPAPSEYS